MSSKSSYYKKNCKNKMYLELECDRSTSGERKRVTMVQQMRMRKASLRRGNLQQELLSWMGMWRGFSIPFTLFFCNLLLYMSSLFNEI